MWRRGALTWTLSVLTVLAVACSTTPSQPAAPAAPKAPDAAKPDAAKPAATSAPAAAAPSGQAAAQPTATPVVEAKTSGPVSGGEVVKITAWTIGPDAPSFYRRDNLIAAAETLNKELEQEGSNQRVQVEATFESGSSGGMWADYKQKFTLATEAKQGPDIILSAHEHLAPWSAAGYVV